MRLQTTLENLEFFAYHGLYPEEKINGGSYTVSVCVDQYNVDETQFNNIESVINYELIYDIVKTEMADRKDLIEAVAANILNKIKSSFKNIDNITVSITKHDPANSFNGANAKVTCSLN